MISYIVDAVPVSADQFYAILQPFDSAMPEPPVPSLLIEWTSGISRVVEQLDFVGIRVVRHRQSVFVVGRLGRIAAVGEQRTEREAISGPALYGFLCDARFIGDDLYVAGMSRQLYSRAPDGVWRQVGARILDSELDPAAITGFRAIDGIPSGDLYAVGLNGEIWSGTGAEWRQVHSPTNLILECVRIVRPDLVVAAGQAGTVVIGRRGQWHVIEQLLTSDDFWGMETFQGSVYLATQRELFRLEGNRIIPLSLSVDDDVRFGRLCAAPDSLWCFGPSHALQSRDGTSWRTVNLNAGG